MKAKFYKNFQIAKCFLFAFFIFHFSFFIFGCSSSSEISKGDLTGSVYLDGSDDHTGISVALYDLAYLDTTIVRINHEYPHIGVIINQHTEFDHRLQSPVATSTTLADGSFLIEDVPTGVYNFVAQKAGWGFRYIYEISISEGDNEISSMYNERCTMNTAKADVIFTENSDEALAMTERRESAGMERFHASSKSRSEQDHYSSFIIHSSLNRISDLTLYPELHLSGDVNDAIVVAPFHHLVCDDDVTFIPGSSLEIQPNAVVRIAPGADMKIMGNFKAQGEENNMFWVTTNDGFANDSNTKLVKRDSLALYNSMTLEPTATVQNDLITWGKWSWGNYSFISSVSDCQYLYNIFIDSSSGLYVSAAENVTIENNLCLQCDSAEYGGVVAFNIENLHISNLVSMNNYNGIYSKFSHTSLIENNYISQNQRGIWGLTLQGNIEHNELIENGEADIRISGDTTVGELNIFYNILRSDVGIKHHVHGSFLVFYYLNINYNNFYSSDYFITYSSARFIRDVYAINNYFFGADTPYLIAEKIHDFSITPFAIVIFQPYLNEAQQDAGVQ